MYNLVLKIQVSFVTRLKKTKRNGTEEEEANKRNF